MADTDKIRDMLDNLINSKPEQAQVDFHDYLQGKMQDVVGPNIENKPASDDKNSDKE